MTTTISIIICAVQFLICGWWTILYISDRRLADRFDKLVKIAKAMDDHAERNKS